MDYKSAADEAARRVLDQVERDGCLHQSSIARVIEDELHRANRAPHMMLGAPMVWRESPHSPAAAGEVMDAMFRLREAIIRRHDPG
jgi:hypothetical protein